MHKPKLSERRTIRLTLGEASRLDAAARAAAITPSELTRRALAKLLDSHLQ